MRRHFAIDSISNIRLYGMFIKTDLRRLLTTSAVFHSGLFKNQKKNPC